MRATAPTPSLPRPALTLKKRIEPTQTRPARDFKYTCPLMASRFDPTGRFLFVTAQDFTIQRVDLEDGKLTPLSGHKSWVRALACHPHAPRLFSGGYEGKVIAWPADAAAPQPEWALDAHKGWVRAVAVSPDGATLASCGNDGLVKLWSASDGKLTAELRGHDCHVYNLAFHPAGKALVSADLKGVVKEWDLASGKAVRAFDAKALYRYDTGFRADI